MSREPAEKSFLWNMSGNPRVPLALAAKLDKSPIERERLFPKDPA